MTAWPEPPRTRNAAGEPRRVGVEMEMSGLDIDRLAALVAEFAGGAVEKRTAYEFKITGAEHGDWIVELDFLYLKKLARAQAQSAAEPTVLEAAMRAILDAGAKAVVPLEVVSPPLPLPDLPKIEDLAALLRAAGARGTADEFVYAFGMQFNPELPDLKAATITAHLQAFLILHDWLKARAKVDLTRRLTVFAEPFPKAYARRVVAEDYAPDQDALIDDYLAANPTRNRALDMLPLFAHLDKKRVRALVDDKLVKARPTFHYRLPNCEIDRADWRVADSWGDWLAVERLAADAERLKRARAAYRALLDDPTAPLTRDWAAEAAEFAAP